MCVCVTVSQDTEAYLFWLKENLRGLAAEVVDFLEISSRVHYTLNGLQTLIVSDILHLIYFLLSIIQNKEYSLIFIAVPKLDDIHKYT